MKRPLGPAILCFAISDLMPLLPDLRSAAGHANAEAIKAEEASEQLLRQATAHMTLRLLFPGGFFQSAEARSPEEASLLRQAEVCAKNARSAQARAARLTALIQTVEANPCS